MKSVLMSQVRLEQTERELLLLSQTRADWLQRRYHDDYNEEGEYIGRHKTQLEAIESTLIGALQTLKDQLDHLKKTDLNQEVEEVYEQCRDFDEALIWIHRLWTYFKEKFDQRDDKGRIGPLLKAADEVVWSCYHQVFIKLSDGGTKHGPAPLCFIA